VIDGLFSYLFINKTGNVGPT